MKKPVIVREDLSEVMQIAMSWSLFLSLKMPTSKCQAQDFADYRSAYLDLYDKVKTDTQTEKVSILDDVDFEAELIHRDVINVHYILTLLAEALRCRSARTAEGSQEDS